MYLLRARSYVVPSCPPLVPRPRVCFRFIPPRVTLQTAPRYSPTAVHSEMTSFADSGTAAAGPEEKCLTSPRPLAVEESASTDVLETKEPAQPTSGGASCEAPGPAATTEVESAVQQAAPASGTDVEAKAPGAENVGDSTTQESGAQEALVISIPKPARAAEAAPPAGAAGKAGKVEKPRNRLSLVARQSALGGGPRRKGDSGSGSGKVVPEGGDKPASRRAPKPTAAPTSAAGGKPAKAPRRVSLVARQTVRASAGVHGNSSGSESGTTNVGTKPASRAEPRPAASGARSAERNTPRRLSLVARQTAAVGAGIRSSSSSSRRGSTGGAGNAGDKPNPAITPRTARTTSARIAGENTPKRTSLVARQAAAGTGLRSKLASRKAAKREGEGEKGGAAAPTSSGSTGVRSTTRKRLSLVARQSAGSSSTTVAAKDIVTSAVVEDCPEAPSVPVPGTRRALRLR